MLVPAICYADVIRQKLAQYYYTEDMVYYTGWLGAEMPTIDSNADGNTYQYAIMDNHTVIGYLSYEIDWYARSADRFKLFSFDRGNVVVGFDLAKELKKIINQYHIHRLEYRVIGGNPAEKNYDNFCKKYNGKKHVLTDCFRDKHGEYHNVIIYEIIFDDSQKYIK